MSRHWNKWKGKQGVAASAKRRETWSRKKMTTGATGTRKGAVEIIVEKIGKRWNKMGKYS